ncbi:hypothetical protein CLU79DRAFT_714741 [Phycomyces nitens]|nr:hypothetical protein CLU79DRAFT_714741 [Phycomyces nitens]
MQFKILALFLAMAFVAVNAQVAAPALTSLASKIGWLENSNNPKKTELIQSAESAYSRISAALAIQTSAPSGAVSGSESGAGAGNTGDVTTVVASPTSAIASAASSAAQATASVADASSSAHGVVNSLQSVAAGATSAVSEHTSAGVRIASDGFVQLSAMAGLIVATCVALMA